ncbi:hypothetical protein GWN42_19135 [candidate division KSB1 bacterium]|nr:hypothetical protein [candidate division KSB1 bacterium]
MNINTLVLTLIFSFTVIMGCDGDNSTGSNGVTITDLVGTWTATKFEFTNEVDPDQKIDLIQLGGSFILNINSDGEFSAILTVPGESPDTSSGTLRIQNGTLFFDDDSSDDVTAEFTLSRNTLTLTISADDAEIDFDDDGQDDPATLLIILQRS